LRADGGQRPAHHGSHRRAVADADGFCRDRRLRRGLLRWPKSVLRRRCTGRHGRVLRHRPGSGVGGAEIPGCGIRHLLPDPPRPDQHVPARSTMASNRRASTRNVRRRPAQESQRFRRLRSDHRCGAPPCAEPSPFVMGSQHEGGRGRPLRDPPPLRGQPDPDGGRRLRVLRRGGRLGRRRLRPDRLVVHAAAVHSPRLDHGAPHRLYRGPSEPVGAGHRRHHLRLRARRGVAVRFGASQRLSPDRRKPAGSAAGDLCAQWVVFHRVGGQRGADLASRQESWFPRASPPAVARVSGTRGGRSMSRGWGSVIGAGVVLLWSAAPTIPARAEGGISLYDARAVGAVIDFNFFAPQAVFPFPFQGGVLESTSVATSSPRGFGFAGMAPVPAATSIGILVPQKDPFTGGDVPPEVQEAFKSIDYTQLPNGCQALFPPVKEGYDEVNCGGPNQDNPALAFTYAGFNGYSRASGNLDDPMATRTLSRSRADDIGLPSLQATIRQAWTEAVTRVNEHGLPQAESFAYLDSIKLAGSLVKINGISSHTIVATDGTPAGTAAATFLTVREASVAGIPVVIGPDGISVDKNQVPQTSL